LIVAIRDIPSYPFNLDRPRSRAARAWLRALWGLGRRPYGGFPSSRGGAPRDAAGPRREGLM